MKMPIQIRTCLIMVAMLPGLMACGSGSSSAKRQELRAERNDVYVLDSNPLDGASNVYPYMKDASGVCIAKTSQSCSRESSKGVTRYKRGAGFVGHVFGLGSQESATLSLDTAASQTFFSKYSGATGTYSAKHYPVAYASDKYTYFVYSGPATLDDSLSVASTNEGGNRVSSAMFQRADGKTNALGIYVARFNPATNKVSAPLLLHVKHTDDPHDNAVVSMDKDGHLWVLISGREARRGALLFWLESPDQQNVFSSETLNIKEISPDNLNYRNQATEQNVPKYAPITYPQLLSTQSSMRLIYTLYCYGVTPQCDLGTRQIWTAELEYNSMEEKAELVSPRKLVAYGGHYALARVAANGTDVSLVFNQHVNGEVSDRTNLFYLFSRDEGQTWFYLDTLSRQPTSAETMLPIDSQDDLNKVSVLEYYRPGQVLDSRVYLQDLLWRESGDLNSPVILFSLAKGIDAHKISQNPDIEVRVAYWSDEGWRSKMLTDEVDHNYSSGFMQSLGQDMFSLHIPATPVASGNGLAGGIPAELYWSLGNTVGHLKYSAPIRIPPQEEYLRGLCEMNYLRGVAGQPQDGFRGMAALANPYKFEALRSNQMMPAAPLVILDAAGLWHQLPLNLLQTEINGEYDLKPIPPGSRLSCQGDY